jgi:hypothetical protein
VEKLSTANDEFAEEDPNSDAVGEHNSAAVLRSYENLTAFRDRLQRTLEMGSGAATDEVTLKLLLELNDQIPSICTSFDRRFLDSNNNSTSSSCSSGFANMSLKPLSLSTTYSDGSSLLSLPEPEPEPCSSPTGASVSLQRSRTSSLDTGKESLPWGHEEDHNQSAQLHALLYGLRSSFRRDEQFDILTPLCQLLFMYNNGDADVQRNFISVCAEFNALTLFLSALQSYRTDTPTEEHYLCQMIALLVAHEDSKVLRYKDDVLSALHTLVVNNVVKESYFMSTQADNKQYQCDKEVDQVGGDQARAKDLQITAIGESEGEGCTEAIKATAVPFATEPFENAVENAEPSPLPSTPPPISYVSTYTLVAKSICTICRLIFLEQSVQTEGSGVASAGSDLRPMGTSVLQVLGLGRGSESEGISNKGSSLSLSGIGAHSLHRSRHHVGLGLGGPTRRRDLDAESDNSQTVESVLNLMNLMFPPSPPTDFRDGEGGDYTTVLLCLLFSASCRPNQISHP